MSTVEDLFVEIFDRKHKIIELVKQHTDRYSQHLATKCKIQGINPPPWLFNSQYSSNLKELNREQPISENFPRPPIVRHASARCSLNKRPVVRDVNEEMSQGTFLEVHVSNKAFHPKDRTTNTAVDPENNQDCTLNTVPELDVSVNSPLDQTDATVLNNFNDLDLSLGRIQRSKSRQKALQLRNSAQAEAKGSSSQQKKCDVAPIRIGLSTSELVDHNYESQKWCEPCVVSNSGGGFRESAKTNHEEREINLHAGENSKHKASTKRLECVNHYVKVNSLSDVAEISHTAEVDSSFATAQKSHSTHKHSCNFAATGTSLSASQLNDFSDKPDHLSECFPVGTKVRKLMKFVEDQHEGVEVDIVKRSRSNCKQLNCLNDSLKVDGSADVVQEDAAGCVSGMLEVANTSNIHKPIVKSYQETEKKNGSYCGRITRSRSMAPKLPCLDDDSTFSDKVNIGVFASPIGESSKVLFNNLDSLTSAKPSLILDHESPKTQSNMFNEVIAEPVDTSTAADSEKSLHGNYDTHSPTGSITEAVMEGSPTCRSRPYNSIPKVGVEHLVANSPHDCSMPMKPKQLDFDDTEECSLKRTFAPNFEEMSIKATDVISNTSLEPTSEKKIFGSLVANRISGEQSTLELEISSKFHEVPGNSFTTEIREPAGTEKNGCASDMNEHHASRNTKYESRGRQCLRQSSYLHDDETLSNDVGRQDAGANVELNLNESHNSMVELHVEVEGGGYDSTAQYRPASYVANTKMAASSHFSSLTKRATGDSQDRLAKNFDIEDPISTSSDAKGRSCTPNYPNLCCFNDGNSYEDVRVKCDMDRDSHQKENGMLMSSPLRSGQNDDENLNLSLSSALETTGESCFDDRFKSKKVEDKQANCFSDCPNSQMSKLYQVHMDAVSLNFNTSQEKTDNIVEQTPFRTKSSNVGISEKKSCHLKEGSGFSLKLLNEVGGKSCDRNTLCLPASYAVNTKTAAARDISTLTGDSQDCLVKELQLEDLTSISPDSKRQPSMPNDPSLSCLDGENSLVDACAKLIMDRHSHQRENMHTWSPRQSGCNDEENLEISVSSEIENARESSLLDGRFRYVKLDSWPQVTRKKIDDKQTNCFSVCPSSQISKLYQAQMDAVSLNFSVSQEKIKNVVEHAPFQAKSSNMGISKKEGCTLKEGIGSSRKLQNERDANCFEKQNISTESASSSDDKLLRTSHASSFFHEPAEKELETEEYELLSNTEKFSDEQDIPDPLHLRKNIELDHPENLTCLVRKSHFVDQSQYSQSFVCSSPQNRDLDILDADQSVLEGFMIDASTADEELDIAHLGINYETTIQRASILEQICKSASAHTPLSHFTSSFGFDHTHNLYQSLPNGLLEHLDLSTFLSEEDVNKQIRASYSCEDEVKDSKLEIPCSDYQPRYECQFGGRSGNQYQSPVGKFWERIPSHSSSSEKALNLNPALMCFPIQEDPSSSAENETAVVAGKIGDEIDSMVVNSHVKRLPLASITNSCLNPPASVSAAERSHARGSLDSVNTDVSCTGDHNKAKRNLGSCFRNMSAAKAKQTFFIGAKGITQGKESLRRSSRPKLSAKSSVKRERQKLSEKGPSRNNIVSTLTSFIPLVQQKQAAAVCTGKREVKVKALEAAEAAKRLEEKKENERKMRKEAMKHERARLEQENSKQLELHKKKKEEEKNKKEADAIKERKRKRVEEARRQQREQDDKTHAKRAEKDKALPTNKKRVGKTFKKQESELKSTETSRNDSFLATPSPERFHISDNSNDNEKGDTECGTKKSREKSYEISPYQCSDDEEDEDDDAPIKKFIPSWASKPNVACALFMQQESDPDSIFPPESFCSMDEVLVPRKVQERPAPI
ncbi:unnamed protein product [Withania somnifera]